MKIFVKTLKGTHFEIEVNLDDTIVDVKKKIESLHGQDVYPAAHQILIHEGKILKYGTTLEENNVSENSFIMIMLSKVAEKTTAPPPPATVTPPTVNASSENNLEASIQQILEMGGGIWDRYTVFHALRAAYNNPEIAVEYLCSGIPETAGPHANPLNVFPEKPEVDDVAELLFSRPGNWSITLEQHFAIERLIGMGFDKSAVIDVFFACEKNEEMTANYLLDHMHDFQ